MKFKIIKQKNELIIDYYKEKQPHEFRYTILEHILERNPGKLKIFIDTNLGVNKTAKDSVDDVLKNENIEFESRQITKTKRELFGFSGFFGIGKKKKPEKTEKAVVMDLSIDELSHNIYDNVLKYYDYGIAIGCTIENSKLLEMYCDEYDELLFNKEIIKKTVYDSLLFSRVRMDSYDRDIENFLGSYN